MATTDYVTSLAVKMHTERCCKCDVLFGFTEEFEKRRRGDKESFYCPNGHPQAYIRSDADRLRAELDQAKADAAAAWRRANEEAGRVEAERRQHSATKGQLTKAKKRAAGGACPCCNRTFVQLAAHMKTKHPGYAADPS